MKVRTLALGFVASILTLGLSAAPSAVRAAVTPNTIVEANHSILVFSVAPGATHVFAFPIVQRPVRIDISESALNGGTQNPTELLSVVVNQDPKSTQFTWIGMNSDGTNTAGNSGVGNTIAQITCGANCIVATLAVNSLSPARLSLSQNATTTGGPYQYIVSMWW